MSALCTGCGSSLGEQDKSCRTCGTPLAGNAGVAAPAAVEGPARTSTKAILSLVFGVCLFIFPLSVVAIILGHLALSEIKQNAGRLTGEGPGTAGLVLGYVGVAEIPIILILAAIAIPNPVRARMAADESYAVASVRTITAAQFSYRNVILTLVMPARGRRRATCRTLMVPSPADASVDLDSRSSNASPRSRAEAISGPRWRILSRRIQPDTCVLSDESAVVRQGAAESAQSCLENGVVLQ